jgi:Fe-Mn family superoxide dismutase
MDFTLTPLPYPQHALEPHLGRETLHYHHEKHHAGYLEKLRELIGSRPAAKRSLEEIILISDDDVFENAAQVWNHDFYWRSMAPDGGGVPSGPLLAAVERDFGGLDEFQKAFVEMGVSVFGTGWVWLVADRDRLRIEATQDADLPLTQGHVALFNADVWEHAYYLDYRNERKRYLETFLGHLVDWRFAAANFEKAQERTSEPVAIGRMRIGGSQ